MTVPSPAAAAVRSLHATVALLAVAAFLSGAAMRICDGLIPRLAREFDVTPGVAGRVVLVFAVAYSAMQLVFGPLGDRLGKARMVCAAVAGCALASVAAALAPGFATLLLARAAWGMAAAGVVPLAMAWIGDAVPVDERQPTLARLLLGTLSGMVAGQFAGGLFGDGSWGWRGAFGCMALAYGVVGVLMVQRLAPAWRGAPVRAAGAAAPPGWRSVVGDAWSRKVLAGAFAEGVLLIGPLAFLPAMLHDRFGLTLSAAAGLIALYAVGGLAYAIAARPIVRVMGQRRMVLAGGWLMGLGCLAWLLSPLAWTAGVIAFVVGFGTYLYHNTLQMHATQMAPAARGTAVSLFAFCLFLGQSVGVWLAGQALDHLGRTALLLPPALLLPAAGWWFARALAAREQATAQSAA